MKPRLRLMLSCEKHDDGNLAQLLNRIGIRIGIMGHGMAKISCFQSIKRLYVEHIDPEKSAALCGIREDDVIEEINGFEICSWADIEKALYSQAVDKPIQFLVRRSDSIKSLAYMAVWPR